MRSDQTLPRVPAQTEAPGAVSTNRVLRNTCCLLSATLFFSAAIAAASAELMLPHPGIVLPLLGFFGLLYAIMKLRNSAWGLAGLLPRQLVLHRPKE